VNGLAVASNGERNPLPAGTAVVDDLPNAGVRKYNLKVAITQLRTAAAVG
jgi:hypothetical protein